MKVRSGWILILLPLALAGCFHGRKKPQPAPPPPVIEPRPEPKPAPQPVVEPAPEPVKPAPAQPEPKPVPAKPSAKKPSAAHYPNANKPAQPDGISAVSALGQLSSGEVSGARQQTLDSLAQTERRLNTLGRTLSGSEQKTAVQIRDFVRQARKALDANDVDGARTLAAKAKTLLAELQR